MSEPVGVVLGEQRSKASQQSRLASSPSPDYGDPNASEKDEIQIVDWDGPTDAENPINWPASRKWLITGTALFATLIVPLNGTSITVASEQINARFHVSDASFPNSYFPVTSWSVGGALFIIVFLPVMEDLGVRPGFLITYAFFLLMIVPQAVATNFATLIVTRFFSGGCVALLANTISSMIPDVWVSEKARTVPVSIYILLYLMGSTLGPVLFAPVVQYLSDWRWIFYIQLICYGSLFPLFFLLIKETRGPVLLRRKAKRLRADTGARAYTQEELNAPPLYRRLLTSVSRPLYLLVTEPVLLASTVWSAFSFGTVFLFTQSVGQVFSGLYGWESYSVGYVQGAVVIGEILGWIVSVYGSRFYLKSATRNQENPGQPIPEARLYASVFGSFIGTTGGMFVYAWTAYPSLPWIAPAVGLGMVGFGIMIVITAVADYITDAYAASDYAASAIGAVAFGENMVAGFLPLAAQRLYTELGYHWASSLLGFLALLLSFAPVIFIWKGKSFRERSPFMVAGGKS